MMIERLAKAIEADRERKRKKLEGLLRHEMKYYDMDNTGDRSMPELIEEIMRITDGKEVVVINVDGKLEG